jgi:DNA repair exonuclease SbcCD ATPase subunit
MKKKFIQILMTLIVAVSVGSFVSCKDTSEDLYNELRTQTAAAFSENASLRDALELYAQKLERELTAIKDGDIPDLTARLNEQSDLIEQLKSKLEELKTTLEGKADQSEIDRLERLINALQDQINGNEGILINLNNLIKNDAAQDALLATLRSEIEDLKAWKVEVENVNREKFTEILDMLSKLQQEMTEAKDKINVAITKADEAKADAAVAKAIAEGAAANAQNALTLAQTADQIASVAKETADKAWELANKAFEAANDANGVAARALALAEANKDAITALQTVTAEIQKLATENQANIKINADKIAQNAQNIEKNAQEILKLKTDITNLNSQITEMNNKLSLMEKDIQQALADASAAAAAASVNAAEIQNLKDYVKDLKNALDNLQISDDKELEDLKEKICCLEGELATMWVSIALLEGEAIAHFEAAKCYADQQIEAAKLSLMLEVKALLADYLKKGDIDFTQYVTKAEIANYVTKAEAANYATKAELANYVSKDVYDQLVAQLTAQMGNLTDADAALSVALNNLTQEMYNKFLAEGETIAGLRERIAKNEADIAWLKDLYNTLSGKVDNCITVEEFERWKEQIETTVTNIGNQIGSTNTFNLDLSGITVTVMTQLTKDLNEKLRILKEELKAELEGELGAMIDGYNFVTQDQIAGLADALTTLAALKDAVEGMEGFEDRIKALEDATSGLADLILDVNLLKSTAVTFDDLKDYVKKEDLKDLVMPYVQDELNNNLDDYLDKLIENYGISGSFKDLLNQIGTNTTSIGGLQTQINTINTTIDGMKTDITNLKTRIGNAETQITSLETKLNNEIAKVTKDIVAIQNALAKQVTGIIIQGTRNPMFGTFSLPTNTQSNVLIAYYGVPKSFVSFPTDQSGPYGERAEQRFSPEELTMLKNLGLEIFETPAGEPLLSERGNAGQIYMTINPNTADLTGLELSIVNTLDEESPIKLRPIRKSEEKLQFGYSRADNGFYEANAYVTPSIVKNESNGIPLTADDITTAFKDVKDNIVAVLNRGTDEAGQLEIGQVASDIFKLISNMKMDQTGLKCTYTTKEADGSEKKHSVYSQYNLGATFFNPLNLDAGKDFNFVTMPGYEAIEEFFNKLAREAKSKVHTFFKDINSSALIEKILNFKIVKIELKDLDPDLVAKFEITVGDDVTIDGLTYHMVLPADANIKVRYAKTFKNADGSTTNLTVNGTTITNIPSDALINPLDPDVASATLVVYGDVTAGPDGVVPMQLVIPVTNDAQKKYVWYDMSDVTSFVSELTADNVLVIDGTNVAQFSGSTLTSLASSINLSEMIDLSSGTTPTLKLEFTYDLRDEMVAVWGQAQGAIADVNKMLQDLKSIIDEFNKTLDKINNYEGKITGEIDHILDDYLMKYLDKVNDLVVGFVNSFNRRLQPFMIASTDKGFKRVSVSKEVPTVLTSDVVIYPTTKTMEVIVPIARKHVAVTNVFKGAASAQEGDTDCMNKLKAANTGELNKVFDGNIRKLEIKGLASGYLYEIAYSVLDFDGNMATHRYYIQVQ